MEKKESAEVESANDFLNDGQHTAQLNESLHDELVQYTDSLMAAKANVEMAENALKTAEKVYNDLARVVLPEILGKAHLSELRLDNGTVIALKEDLKCSIPKDTLKRSVCMQFLRSKGFADNIKQQVVISESDDQRVSQELLDLLTESGVSYDRTEDVHSQTLKKIMRDLTGIGKDPFAEIEKGDIPDEFGLFLYKEAIVRQK